MSESKLDTNKVDVVFEEEERVHPNFINLHGEIYCKLPEGIVVPRCEATPVYEKDELLEKVVIPPADMPIDFYMQKVKDNMPEDLVPVLKGLIECAFDPGTLEKWHANGLHDLSYSLYCSYSYTLARLLSANRTYCSCFADGSFIRISADAVSKNMHTWFTNPETAVDGIDNRLLEACGLLVHDAATNKGLIAEYAAYITGLLDARATFQDYMVWEKRQEQINRGAISI